MAKLKILVVLLHVKQMTGNNLFLLEIFSCNDQMNQIDLIINSSWILISF
jgi:hypothetical protein